ncbi:MAG TPA: single-stranded-DNA-specific exonuclease RecJ, partial [Coxiellaceae bacterium]|nr:single-stranded-DNA-specific exonuclease RecJ [Coxiellaceae bacterium]
AQRLAQALANQERILVIGDFDADGATSTALAVAALKAMGATDINYLVPNRFTYGYGLTPQIVELAKTKNPHLIITVDNGISSTEGVQRAHELNIDVLITDHHLAGKELPSACIIVNPNQPNDTFPSKAIAGVGVIFYVMLALRSYLLTNNWFEKRQLPIPVMAQFLDLVALGTVADVVSLDKNNRILVHQGLGRIRKGAARPGIQALLQIARREAAQLSANDLGFALAPRLNAAGRLDDMSLGINCLLAEDSVSAYQMALQLEQLNNERRELEAEMQKQAFAIVERMHFTTQLPVGLCLYDPSWHQGIVGLVASRVKDKTCRPVIAFARVDGGNLKASARSVTGIHIRDCLENIAAAHHEILQKFGGHAMEAGLTIKEKDFKHFAQLFAAEVEKQSQGNEFNAGIESDGELATQHLNLELAQILRNGGPWGSAFPEPCFDGIFEIIDQRLVGQKHLKLLLKLPDSPYYHDAIAFSIDPEQWPNHRAQRVHCVYKLDVNEYQNRQRLQLLIEELEAV